MSATTENNNQIIDDSSTEKTKGVGITNLSAGHKRIELNTFTLLNKLFRDNIITKEVLVNKLNEIHFYGTIPEKTAYWNSYETEQEEKSRKANMKLFVDTEKAIAKAEAKTIAKAEAKASAPKKTKKSTKKDEEAATAESSSDHEKEEIAHAVSVPVPVPEPVKVEVAAPLPEKVEDTHTNDSKKKKKNAKKESHAEA